MRPRDPRYMALPLSEQGATVDASVRCVVICWPVIDPLGRYQYARKHKDGGDPKMAKKAENWLSCHDQYWPGEAAMAEGNPTLALERGEPVQMPPVLYLQGTADIAHPKPNRDQFVAGYRKAGGRVDLHMFEGVGEGFITDDPDSTASREAIEKIIEFVHREITGTDH